MDTLGDQKRLVFDRGDRLVGSLSRRADLAEACLQALRHPGAGRATFEMIENEHKNPPAWRALFYSLV